MASQFTLETNFYARVSLGPETENNAGTLIEEAVRMIRSWQQANPDQALILMRVLDVPDQIVIQVDGESEKELAGVLLEILNMTHFLGLDTKSRFLQQEPTLPAE